MKTPMDLALVTPTDMAEADRLTIEAGTSGEVLMERAGEAVAAEAMAMLGHRRRVAVLVGPGHNGGDGFVAARRLAEEGCDVRVFSVDPKRPPRGDAAGAAVRWSGPVLDLARYDPAEADLVVDALFGAGLDRRIEGAAAAAMERTRDAGVAVLSVDLPSGVSGETGAILGTAFAATATVTFFRRKPGHLLQPGRWLCGRVSVADIGIADGVLDAIAPKAFANGPALWPAAFRAPAAEGHKYARGHAV
ncbi:MAG: NAD(P)H-hydrate epimerase, partial [Rhizobiaceae bacterium]|nr:NAD(P)H-hydrate epimerase [Rhizobiaceae bacterium]